MEVYQMDKIFVYFSDFFNVDKKAIEKYGAVNISLINDIPLFIDPFLLFNSHNPEFQEIHDEMIKYLYFLKDQVQITSSLSKGMKDAWFNFPEVKQTWLGFSTSGNAGKGMGGSFAEGLYTGLQSIFKDFGENSITQSQHMEKLCLISPRIGRDKISDFTTNFVKQYLLKYTEEFARTYISKDKCNTFTVNKVCFNWDTHTWETKEYFLPCFNNDFVLLTPRSILKRDDTFINRRDLYDNIHMIALSIPDATLRFELNHYFSSELQKKRKLTKSEKWHHLENIIRTHSEILDYYLKYKEDQKEQATAISEENVSTVEQIFNEQTKKLILLLSQNTRFYKIPPDSYKEARRRLLYLKQVIENQDGYKLFYQPNNQPIKRESDLQVIYRLVWYGSQLDVNREVNNGRGPVDFKISYGKKNSTLVEFKLASNTKLKQNLKNQVEIYKAASETHKAIIAIMFFSDKEKEKLNQVLGELKLTKNENIILIDARNNKPSASNVKIQTATLS